jgi:hypothetical protein
MANNLSVSVTADTTDLRTKLALAQADLKAFGAETRTLAQSIRAGSDSTGALRGQLQQVAAQFNRSKAEVAGLTANLRAATAPAGLIAKALAAIGVSSTGVTRANSAISGATGSLGALLGALGPIAPAIAAAFGVQQIITFTRAIAKLGEDTQNAADILGISVEAFSRLSIAMEIAGADADTAQRTIEKLGRSVQDALVDPSGTAATAFDNLGIKMEVLKRHGNDTEAMLRIVANAWLAHEKGLLRAGAAQEILGRGMDKLIPLLNKGAAGIDELKKIADETGAVLSRNTAAALAETDDKFDKLGKTIKGAGIASFLLFKPVLDSTINGITALIAKFTEAIKVMLRWADTARRAVFDVQNAIYKLTHGQDTSMVAPRSLLDEEPEKPGGTEKVGTKKAGGGKGAGRDDRLSDWRDELREKLTEEQNFFKDSKADELAFWQAKAALVQGGSAQDIKLRKEVNAEIFKLEKDLAVQNQTLRLEQIDYFQKLVDQEYSRKKAQIDAELQLGRITAEEAIAQERRLFDRKAEVDQSYYDKRFAAAENDVNKLTALQRQWHLSQQENLAKIEDLNVKAAEASKAAWDKVFAPLESAFDSAIKGFIQGTTSLYQALSRAGETLILDPLLKNLTGGLKSAFQGAFGDISGNFIGKFFSGTLLSDIGSQTAAKAAGGALDLSAVGIAGAEFAATTTATGATFAATVEAAGLGFAASVTAAAAAETASSGVDTLFNIFEKAGTVAMLAFKQGGIVPSAAGGWMVPQTASGGVLAQLHSKEMVLPAGISQGLQGILAGGGTTSNRSQAINLTYAPTVNAPEHMGLNQLLARDSRAMTGFIKSRIRDGGLEAPGGWMR